jgi:hypothetical protein
MAGAPTQMAITSSRSFWCLCSVRRQVTPAGEHTFGIEGPAADLEGNLFVVNLGKPGTSLQEGCP